MTDYFPRFLCYHAVPDQICALHVRFSASFCDVRFWKHLSCAPDAASFPRCLQSGRIKLRQRYQHAMEREKITTQSGFQHNLFKSFPCDATVIFPLGASLALLCLLRVAGTSYFVAVYSKCPIICSPFQLI